MGLIPTFCRFLMMTHKKVGFKGPVLTLGNQDVWASYEDLKSWAREFECSYSEPTIIPNTSALFRTYPPLIERAKEFVHAKTFFAMLGISDYWDIDKSDYEKPTIIHDLNLPVPSGLDAKFNLIVDSGTMEHVFDIRQVLENIIRLCRKSGWIVHFTPASNFLDHGFYSFSPIFFYDLYSANGFDNFSCYILQHDAEPLKYFNACPCFEYTYGMDFNELIDPHRKTVVFFAARKTANVRAITIPTQGFYATQQNYSTSSSQTFASFCVPSQMLAKPVCSLLRPFLIILRHIRKTLLPRYHQLRKL
ncbi:hypothetical protein BROC_00377 [Candidatus Brocadiaceae bacterium]|nr:hypothetical protein BROC_00377 [Candidatus Brocadiaceae bacterium]